MDIYSSKKKARHAKQKHAPQRVKKAGNINKNSEKKPFFGFLKNSKKPKSKKAPLTGNKKKTVIALISVASCLGAILLGFVIWVVIQISGIKKAADKSYDPNFQNEVIKVEQKDGAIYNIALFGIDTRDPESFKGLSDSMMILSLDTNEKEIRLISLMRDTLVPIEYNGKTIYGKLNSAYSRGGPALAVNTINKVFDLDIQEYATVNFYGMADIIDEMGGIEIDVQEKEINVHNGLNHNIREQAYYMGIKNPPLVTKAGKQKLSGIQAVAWARIRSTSTAEGSRDDFGRTDRQRVVMEALLNKALNQNILKYPDIAKTMLGFVKTSLSFDEMWSLATDILSPGVEFHQTRVPQPKYLINYGLSVPNVGSTVYFDLDFGAKIIDSFIYANMSQEEFLEKNPIEKNAWYDGPVNEPKPDDPDDTSSDVNSGDGTSSGDGSSDITSSGDTTSTDTSSEGSSSEDTPSEDTPSEDTPSEDTPSEDTPSENTPSEPTGDEEPDGELAA